ncbi:MAG: ribonuclease HII [Patescibacteria group bacterium]
MIIHPTWQIEEKYLVQGYKLIAGVDEAGRGAWAGPIVAGAVIFDKHDLIGLRDSKLLSPAQREKIYAKIITNAIAWNAGIVTHEEIDTIGIGPANKLAMERAVAGLKPTPDVVLIDAFKIDCGHTIEAIIKGDQKVCTIAAASIIAKVTRDRMLIAAHAKYPKYGFNQHKGYGTASHRQAIEKFGASAFHRMSFEPMKSLGKNLKH